MTTIALIERKPTITRDLFTRYWRDVHGVMAARIPGFHSYAQHHVTPLGWPAVAAREPFEGIAIVTYADEADREGLAVSEVTKHILRDEQNVFRRALLYNLGPDDCWSTGVAPEDAPRIFFVVPHEVLLDKVHTSVSETQAISSDVYELNSNDPAAWNSVDVAEGGCGRSFKAVISGAWRDAEVADQDAKSVCEHFAGEIGAYRVDESFVMVRDGRPTALGLRGFDALRTIVEAGANNQLSREVERAVFGL